MMSILIFSGAWGKTGLVAGALWSIGILATLNASMYFWVWADPEGFQLYTSESTKLRNVTALMFWFAVVSLAIYVLAGWVS